MVYQSIWFRVALLSWLDTLQALLVRQWETFLFYPDVLSSEHLQGIIPLLRCNQMGYILQAVFGAIKCNKHLSLHRILWDSVGLSGDSGEVSIKSEYTSELISWGRGLQKISRNQCNGRSLCFWVLYPATQSTILSVDVWFLLFFCFQSRWI